MADTVYASGRWHVQDGKVEAFKEQWREFLSWTRDNYDTLIVATLIEADGDPNSFVSFAAWESAEARDEWRGTDGFMKRFMACRELCDEFEGEDYALSVQY